LGARVVLSIPSLASGKRKVLTPSEIKNRFEYKIIVDDTGAYEELN
jgi:hypothetical protein